MLVSIGTESIPQVEFFKRQEREEKEEKVCTLSILPTPQVCALVNLVTVTFTTNRDKCPHFDSSWLAGEVSYSSWMVN